MRFLLASISLVSFLAQHALSSSATGLELVQQYYLYRMECMVYGPDKTKLVGDNQRLPPTAGSFGVGAQEPVHPRPKGSAENGMLTFFEFERDLTDPDRVNGINKKDKKPVGDKDKYNMDDTTGGRMTTNPDGKLIGEKFLSWNRGMTVPWRLTTEIYDEVLADWQQKTAASRGKKVMPSYTGAGTAAKMGEILDKVRKDFDSLPNKGLGLADAFNDLFGKFKKNLDDGVAYRRLDNAAKTIDWYEKAMKWPRADLVIEKVTLPDGSTFDDLNTDKTVAGFNGDATKLAKWQKDTTALSGAPGKQRNGGDYKMVASHLNVIQAWQRVQSTARVPTDEC
ncbi:hypothetical protein B0T18DRAFT_451117 [Schizothecium vesticola]|uniref:Uncharacterized protein n=1 Tax=Schizothecium vesticola TaxID=314040 RepID=A0AA40KB99_9PEZI|nr:hypothetical protein B0T18DRAFT_451117 [Schizothecium vesticola]